MTPRSIDLHDRGSTTGLVHIVSGSFGAGHDAAAAAIADQLAAAGLQTRTWDVVDLMPGRLGRAMRSGYLRQVQSAPATWSWLLHVLERHEGLADGVRDALRTIEGGLLSVAEERPDAWVSTHPFASQALGHLRSSGRLTAPVTTYLTDMSVHRLWVHPGVDDHLAIHDIPARQALTLGARSASVVQPAVSAAFAAVGRDPWRRPQARQALGLPPLERLALITGGSCGIGRLMESARDVAATRVVTPVVLCGTNSRLLARVRRRAGMVGVGWVDDMPALLSAVDVVVQNAGGITSLETAAAGVPMISYRCIAGHGATNAAALEAAGVAAWVRRRDDLGLALLASLRATPLGMPCHARRREVVDTLIPAPVRSA
jgi:processive 1,2-diacylglycerol beta-glucosyltransferase